MISVQFETYAAEALLRKQQVSKLDIISWHEWFLSINLLRKRQHFWNIWIGRARTRAFKSADRMLTELASLNLKLTTSASNKNKPGRPKSAPAQGSKRAKCFECAKGHYCEKFYQIYAPKMAHEGIPIKLENRF